MQLAYVLTIASVVTIGTANQESFMVCLKTKGRHAMAVCPRGAECTPECASAIKEIPALHIESCCAELEVGEVGQQRCVRMMSQGVDKMEAAYDQRCPGMVDDFISVLREVLPLAYDTQAPTAVSTAPRDGAGPNSAMLALAAGVAGAVGACVALAVASWKNGKQEILLAD